MKICSVCKSEKEVSGNFNKRSTSKDGYQNICKSCSAKNSRKHYVNNTEQVKSRTKSRKKRIQVIGKKIITKHLSSGCIDCGEKDIVVLDFDHKSDKKYNVGQIMHSALSIDKLELEIAKCEVRCANCHRRKTAKEFNWWRVDFIGE